MLIGNVGKNAGGLCLPTGNWNIFAICSHNFRLCRMVEYRAHSIVGEDTQPGRVILAIQGTALSGISKPSSGHGMAAWCYNIRIINLYAQSVTAKGNFHHRIWTEGFRLAWYIVIHNITRTSVRMYRINLPRRTPFYVVSMNTATGRKFGPGFVYG